MLALLARTLTTQACIYTQKSQFLSKYLQFINFCTDFCQKS